MPLQMNTSSLENALKILFYCQKIRINFFVTDASDSSNSIKCSKFPFVVIQNVSNKLTGGHWVAFFVKNRREFLFFDSFGKPLSHYPLLKIPAKHILQQNCFQLQSSYSYT